MSNAACHNGDGQWQFLKIIIRHNQASICTNIWHTEVVEEFILAIIKHVEASPVHLLLSCTIFSLAKCWKNRIKI